MGIFVNSKGILACLLQGIWDIWYPPIQSFLIHILRMQRTTYDLRLEDIDFNNYMEPCSVLLLKMDPWK